MRRALLSLLIALVSAASFAGVIHGSEGHKIVFLELTLVDGEVRLDNVKIVPGKLKTPRLLSLVPGRILFTVLGEDQTPLYEGVVRDPSNIRYEYVDEDGRLQSKWVVSDSASFMVRMPYLQSIQSARFQIIPGTPGSAKTQLITARSLGSIEIDLKGGSDED